MAPPLSLLVGAGLVLFSTLGLVVRHGELRKIGCGHLGGAARGWSEWPSQQVAADTGVAGIASGRSGNTPGTWAVDDPLGSISGDGRAASSRHGCPGMHHKTHPVAATVIVPRALAGYQWIDARGACTLDVPLAGGSGGDVWHSIVQKADHSRREGLGEADEAHRFEQSAKRREQFGHFFVLRADIWLDF